MFDLIIPTLFPKEQKGMKYTIQQAIDSELVNQIIIIDNSSEINELTYKSKKITIIQNKTNNYVNPSWNQGVNACNSDYYFIINDDVCIHKKIFSIAKLAFKNFKKLNLLTFKEHEGKSLSEYSSFFLDNSNQNFSFSSEIKKHSSFTPSQNGVIGSCFCGKKNVWSPIPNSLKIWFGDYYIYEKLRKNKLQILQCSAPFLHVKSGSTVRKKLFFNQIKPILKKDEIYWNSIKIKENF